MMSMPTMPQSMCCLPASFSPPSSRFQRNCTNPHVNRKKPKGKIMRIAGLMMKSTRRSTSSVAGVIHQPASAGAALVRNGVYLNPLRNDRVGRGNLERVLQETDDAPDGNHHENRDDAVHHYLQALCLVLTHVPEVFDETPEEHDDGERDEKADKGIQKRIKERQRVEEARGTRKRRKSEQTDGQGRGTHNSGTQ